MRLNSIIIKIFFISLLIASLCFAQSDEIARRRAVEHESVRNYMLQQLQNSNRAKKADLENAIKFKKSGGRELSFQKTTGPEDRKDLIMNGNRITVEIYNYGGIGPGFGLIRNVNNFVWKDLGYVFAFGPLVGAMIQEEGKTGLTPIISDGLNDYTSPLLQEVDPANTSRRWQWQPLPGYADPDQPRMASTTAPDTDGDGKPDSWPRSWYNPTLGQYVWPGFLSQNATNADLEAYWAMDDRDNIEFDYYPFPEDTTRKGLGVQIDGRAFQWSNALAENTIFFVYTITNVSGKDLDSVFFGIYGDPDLGGGSPENQDDNGFFVPPYSLDTVNVENVPPYARSMVYFFDPDGKGNFGLPLGYLGCKFLESPGNAENGINDDGDFDVNGIPMIDERQDDGIDNDGDWNADLHDLGIDGIPNTFDEGEGDGVPTAGLRQADGSPDALFPGEPNFEFTDLDESDQIGLTSFNSWTWNQDNISNDVSMWNRSIPGNFGAIQQNTDLVFIYGSGYISLKAGETKRISMALLVGEDLDDLLISAEVVQTIYNQNYQFFKPPNTPTVKAVPGDKKVTLYWDRAAEDSDDPITGKDFQGYVIYRSTDPSFEDIKVITDGKGTSFLSEPLKTSEGLEAKWDLDFRPEPFVDKNFNGIYDAGEDYSDWDNSGTWSSLVEDPWEGYHPVPYRKRGIQYYLGDNSGLVHSFVDSNNVINGQTYYYAIVAYDHGDSVGIPVSETTKKITVDPITSLLTFDKNTVQVIPGPRVIGYEAPKVDLNDDIVHTNGIGTGSISYEILNDLAIVDGGEYIIAFTDSITQNRTTIAQKNYSILSDVLQTEEFLAFGTNFTKLTNEGLSNDEFIEVRGSDATVYVQNQDYLIDYARGAIRRTENSLMPDEKKYFIDYRYYPVFQSTYLTSEDGNAAFDGVKVKVEDVETLAWDEEKTQWIVGQSNYDISAKLSTVGSLKELYPGDFEIEFSDELIDSAITFSGAVIKIPVNYSVSEVSQGVPQRLLTFLSELPQSRNLIWDPGESIIAFKPGSQGSSSDTLTWEFVVKEPADTTLVPAAPVSGDILFVATARPFNNDDEFLITTKAGNLNSTKARNMLKDVFVVPNPYVGYNIIEPTNTLPGQNRGERRIYFENLPSECTIRIFTLSGDPVAKIEHFSGLEHGRAFWNLLNTDGFGVSYGVYIAHIDAGDLGEKIVKFAIIK